MPRVGHGVGAGHTAHDTSDDEESDCARWYRREIWGKEAIGASEAIRKLNPTGSMAKAAN